MRSWTLPPARDTSRVSFSPFRRRGGLPRKEGVMPVHRGKDSKGAYYQWGDSGKKYRYETGDKSSRERARSKAEKQGQAARASGYKARSFAPTPPRVVPGLND